jgi:PAS domain S-box-containing protein
MNTYNKEALKMEIAVSIESEKLKNDMIHFESMLKNEYGALHLQDGNLVSEQGLPLISNHDITKHLSHDLGIETAVYIKENDDFRCIATSIIDSRGKSAIDTFLGSEGAEYNYIKSGEEYAGEDVILGDDYLTVFHPVFEPGTNEVIGILFTGIKMTAIKNIIEEKSGTQTTQTNLIRTGFILLGALLVLALITTLLRIIADKKTAEERLQIIFDSTPLGVNIHSKKFDFFDCNESAIKMFGLSSKQEYIDKFHQLSPKYQPDSKLSSEKMADYINQAFAEGYCRFEWMHQNLNGDPMPCEITLVRTKYNNDFIITAYVRDLRELKQMMKEIQRRESLLNTVNIAAGVLLSINDEKSFKTSLLKSFELIGHCLDVDRVQIWRNEMIDDELHFVHRYEWLSECGKGCVKIPIGLHFPYSSKPQWKELFLRSEYINAPLSKLPESDRDFLKGYEMKSIIIIPMFLENNFWGFFSVDDCHAERTFTDDEIHILTSLGLMMTNAIDRNLHIAKVRGANERVQIMFDAMPLGASYHDVNLKIIDCNEGILKLFSLSSKQECFERFEELSPEYQPDGQLSKDKISDMSYKAFVEGYSRFESMQQNLNGEQIPCEITLVRVKHYDDFVLLAYVRDLRELKAATTEINKSKQSLNLLKSILNGIDAEIYVSVPHTGELLFVNDYMKKQSNIEGDCTGKLCYKVFLDEKQEEICDFCPCYELDKNPHSTIMWEMRLPSNRISRNATRYIEWSDGRIVQIQHSVDITELINVKEQAIQANNAKSDFLAKMSHEIRTPMNAILGITEIQLQKEKLPDDIQEALGKINNSGYLLLGIINNILDMSKIESGKLELDPISYDVPSLINDTVHLNAMLYNNKEIDFILHVDKNIPLRLLGDELRIKQIINNLLSNAFKYTDKGEISMSISAEYQKENPSLITLVFLIADTGQGMTEEQLEKLFDEFTRFNIDVNREVEGAGLGMNITKQLVHMMDGKIDVKSKLGKGTLFTVRLPQKIESTEVLGEEIAEKLGNFRTANLSQIKNKTQLVREYMPYGRILIVEDVETNLYVAKGLMSPYGLSIETASSGYEMIDKIKNGAVFDIIFLDHFMPKMDGIEAEKIIREMGYTHPVIALTANAIVGQAEVFLENGFDGFISKPIDIRQLNAVLNKLVRDKYPLEVVEAARREADIIKERSVKEAQPSSEAELKAIFSRDAENAHERIKAILSNGFRRSDDIRQYVIDVHSMKSALANMGEDELSAVARKLEMAGRAKEIEIMISETPAFLEALRETIERIKPKEDDFVQEISEDDLKYLSEKMIIIQKASEDYDEITANSVLVELGQKKWTLPVKEQLNNITMHLLHSDFEKAGGIAKNYLDKQ